MHMSRSFGDVGVKGAENQALNIQNDIGNVLDYTFSSGELMLNTFNLNCGRLCAVQRG